MTAAECVAKYHHELWGIMLDAGRSEARGAARALLETSLMAKVDLAITAIYHDLMDGIPKVPAQPAAPTHGAPAPRSLNGAPAQPRKVSP